MSHIYTVSDHAGRTLKHVQAKSKGEARRVATSGITVKRLDGGEILDLHPRGIAITDAETGKSLGAEDESPNDGQESMGFSNEEFPGTTDE